MAMEKGELLSLIISQLQAYNLNSIAQVVAEASGTPISYEPSSRLAELTALGLATASSGGGLLLDTSSTALPSASASPSLPPPAQLGQEGDDAKNAPANLVIQPKGGEGGEEDLRLPAHQAPIYTLFFTTQHRGIVLAAKYARDGKTIAVGSQDSTIKLLDTSRMEAVFRRHEDTKMTIIRTIYDHTAPVNALVFHPNSIVLASGSDDCSIKLYDMEKGGKRSFRYLQDAYAIKSLDFHPAGDFLIAGTDHEAVRIYDVHTLKCFIPQHPADHHTAGIRHVQYSPNGKVFASASADGSVKVYDPSAGKAAYSYMGAHSGAIVNSVAFSQNGHYLLTAGQDPVVRLWDMRMNAVVMEYAPPTPGTKVIANATFTHNDDLVVAADPATNAVLIWDASTGIATRHIPQPHHAPITCVTSSPVNVSLFTGGEDQRGKYWNVS